MSFELPSGHRTSRTRPAWSGLAIVVEAMVLLLFLVGSLAILTQLFTASAVRAREGRDLAEAVAAATSCAERFSADPAGAEGTTQEGDLTVSCVVDESKTGQGTLWHATITICADGSDEAIYTLETSRYERQVE